MWGCRVSKAASHDVGVTQDLGCNDSQALMLVLQ
jgi:hypothetical protein